MDTLKDYIYTMESCNSCGQCRFLLGPKTKGRDYVEICPIYKRYLFESYSGQGLINIAQELLEGTLEYEEGLKKHIYLCTTCGACDVNCKSVRDMEVMDTILALRAKCVEDGQGPMPEHKKYAGSVEKHHNIYGKPHSGRFEWLPEGIMPIIRFPSSFRILEHSDKVLRGSATKQRVKSRYRVPMTPFFTGSCSPNP